MKIIKLSSALVFLVALLSACAKEKSGINISHNDSVLAELQTEIQNLKHADDSSSAERALHLEKIMHEKRTARTLVSANSEKMREAMSGHTDLYSFEGRYKVLVIPVQFRDVKFDKPDFYPSAFGQKAAAQEYLFGDNENSMTTFYRHASFGKFLLEGEVAPIVTVDKNLVDYGEAVFGNSDKDGRGLVVDALQKLKDAGVPDQWWESFDNWDLFDYDGDNHFNEPDGFIDAVILVFAGKAQSSCQRSFDPNGERPPTASVPAGPRYQATVECFNRLWPHRWTVSVPSNDPRYTAKGPIVEGIQRPSMNGFKLSDHVFALDYNMQAEYSALSTLIHEFGHSLTLPDIYAYSGDNNTGGWDAMSSTSTLIPQEFSSFSKLSLGWLQPKIILQGQKTSAYLGHYNFIPTAQRYEGQNYQGPISVDENFGDEIHTYDVVSTVPQFNEPVYRSLAVMTEPTKEMETIIEVPSDKGSYSAYSGRFDGTSRSLILHLQIPMGIKQISFDTIYFIETETNFDSKDEEIRVITDYDIGGVYLNDELKQELRTVSGDANADTLAEANPACDVETALELRKKKNSFGLSESEKQTYQDILEICQKPIWITTTLDVSKYEGKDLKFEIRYTTDAGYTEFGIVIDNLRVGADVIDFENQPKINGGFTLLKDGQKENRFNQFYLMEYRDPQTNFDGESFNLDKNISVLWKQSMFTNQGESLMERFRMIEMDHQPGLLVWYYNTKFDTRSNTPLSQKGKGYLLVVNPKVREIILPDLMGATELRDADGDYLGEKNPAYSSFEKQQREIFGCFAHSEYYSYVEGRRPQCQDESERDAMLGLEFDGRPMVYRREAFNDILPIDQYDLEFVGEPFRTEAEMRTGIATFRPATWDKFRPFRIYKAENGKMVLDKTLTKASFAAESIDSFDDAKNALHPKERFHADNAVVEKKGFHFKVVDPSDRIVDLYQEGSDANANDYVYRKPKIKVLIDWK